MAESLLGPRGLDLVGHRVRVQDTSLCLTELWRTRPQLPGPPTPAWALSPSMAHRLDLESDLSQLHTLSSCLGPQTLTRCSVAHRSEKQYRYSLIAYIWLGFGELVCACSGSGTFCGLQKWSEYSSTYSPGFPLVSRSRHWCFTAHSSDTDTEPRYKAQMQLTGRYGSRLSGLGTFPPWTSCMARGQTHLESALCGPLSLRPFHVLWFVAPSQFPRLLPADQTQCMDGTAILD